MNRNLLKENRNESHTLKKLRNRRIINPILNSNTIDSNVQTTEKDNKKSSRNHFFYLLNKLDIKFNLIIEICNETLNKFS
ncbi:hypothetical protein BpHYR1_045796 [Brachionus plicatilis]|uniref:Uncharacterized protein n=1 Tax=Brachionus plicatilis TaxID=10195 RepID=A0A3M7QWT8_BRAPC|nr:hypothetical protein BpHYR1_045796 [Brachionus plicatilis]